MSTFEITQALNWYKSNVMTMNKSGSMLAYGSRTIIVLVKGLDGNSVYNLHYDRLRLNTKLASGRIGAVSFSHQTDTHEDAYYLASIDDFNVYIWKVNSLICEHIHCFGNKKNKNIALIDVAWLYGCLTVVTISDGGTLHKWDIQSLKMYNYTLEIKISPLTLAACPHRKNIIAIGCKSGNIVVYDLTGNGRVLHKLHYHERNIVSLAWCPVPYNPLSSDQSTEPLLLASTACDRTGLYICRAGTDMYNEVTVSLPNRPIRKSIYKNKTNLIWSCIKWVAPTVIIVTTAFGEIIKVKLQNARPSIITLLCESHKDVIFSIACPTESAKPYLWSSCMGRKLIRTPLFDTTKTEELSLEVPTIGGFVYCFALSPVNSADFAFGLGDGRIYYWNVSNNQQLELITLNYLNDSKVLSLAFHPQDEGLLAFGVGDGRVGIFNLTKKRKNMDLLKTVISHPIYRLCWAPLPNTKGIDNAKLALYAVGNGQIIIYGEMNLWKDPYYLKEYVKFDEIEANLTTPVKRIEMAWKPDYDVVVVGNSNGSIYLLDGDTLKLKHVVHGHDQSVECIVWHPTHVTCDYSEESKFKNYFASSSHSIRVHKLNEDDDQPSLVVEFKGHKEKINELAWSPHRNLMLLSCSNDFTAKIWDVQKCTLIGVYSKHLCTVLCGMFSPLDPDIVFTGSADHSIHSWRVSKDLHNEIVEFKKNQEAPNIVKELIVTKDKDASNTGNSNSSKEKTNKVQQFPFSSYGLFVGKHLEKAVDNFIDSHYENKESVDDTEINYLAFFEKNENFKQLLVEEYNAFKKKPEKFQTVPLMNNINMWGQNLESYFKDAIETKTIDDWMIAVAPSVSYELWTKMCDTYAGQLEDIGEVTKASTYLVAIKKFKEAATMLAQNNLFREALAVVKSQDIQDDEFTKEIIKKWAEYNSFHGHPKEAAHCYLSIGDAKNAISCLIKIKQVKELSLAAKLAQYIDGNMEESLIVNILKIEYFKHHKWNQARELLKNHPKLDYLNMWIGVHETMFELDPKVTHKMFKNWICNIDNTENLSIVDYILNHVEYKPDYYDKLVKIVESDFISDTTLLMPKIAVFVAGQFCLIALHFQKTGLFTIESQKCLIKCLAVAYDYETMFGESNSKLNKLLSRLLMWIFPKGPLSIDLFANFQSDDNLMKTIRSYLCYACFSWFKPLFTSLKKKINLPLDNNEEKSDHLAISEIVILSRQFQQLFDNFKNDLMDFETSAYFKAKKEVERINQLLTGGSSMDNIKDKLNGCDKLINPGENNKDETETIELLDSSINLTPVADETNVKSSMDMIEKLKIVDDEIIIQNQENESNSSQNINYYLNNNTKTIGDIVCVNSNSTKTSLEKKSITQSEQNLCLNSSESVEIENEKGKKELCQFYQNLILDLENFNCSSTDQSTFKHVAHLGIEASKKKELENVMTVFESKRISSPNPFLFVAELKKIIHELEQY